MTVQFWCLVRDGAVVGAPRRLPEAFEDVSNFHALPEEDILARGWRRHRVVAAPTGTILTGSTREITETEVIETQTWREPTPEDTPVPQSVSPRQLRLALLEMDLLDAVEAAVAQADRATQIMWEYAIVYERSHPAWEQMAASLDPSCTAADVDMVFRLAGRL
jgi:hypothetical protein